MIYFKVIRGYKLKLFAERLDIHPEFIERINIKSLYYVYQIMPLDELSSRVVLLSDMPILFEAQNVLIDNLVETFELEDEPARS